MRRPTDERGMSMIAVLISGTVLLTIGATVTIRVAADHQQISTERRWERALHAADSGLDAALFALTENTSFETGETLPASFGSRSAEEAWVIEQAADNAVVAVAGAEYSIVKPANTDGSRSNVVYAVGFVPTRANPHRTRVVRSEYDFAPFVPGVALLSGGNISISGNLTLLGDAGSAHANGNVTISGNPSTSGYVAASGAYNVSGNPTIGNPGQTGGGKPSVAIPSVSARDYYHFSQYDLCPNGEVRTGPAYQGAEAPNATSTPCLGTLLDDASSDEFRGWRKTGDDASAGAKWDYGGNVAYDGVYYIYQGSAYIGGNPGETGALWSATVFAEATESGGEPGCPHVGGDITVSGNPGIRYHNTAQPMQFLAGRDLKVSGNPDTGQVSVEGVLAAHEQIDISGNPEVHGAFIAESVCNTTGSPVSSTTFSGNPRITYSGGLELPGGNDIRSTLWLEL